MADVLKDRGLTAVLMSVCLSDPPSPIIVIIVNNKDSWIHFIQNKQGAISDYQISLSPGTQTYFHSCPGLLLAAHLLDSPCIIRCSSSHITHFHAFVVWVSSSVYFYKIISHFLLVMPPSSCQLATWAHPLLKTADFAIGCFMSAQMHTRELMEGLLLSWKGPIECWLVKPLKSTRCSGLNFFKACSYGS